jgi:hypothetical protein
MLIGRHGVGPAAFHTWRSLIRPSAILDTALAPGRRGNLALALVEIERRIQVGLAAQSYFSLDRPQTLARLERCFSRGSAGGRARRTTP